MKASNQLDLFLSSQGLRALEKLRELKAKHKAMKINNERCNMVLYGKKYAPSGVTYVGE